MNKIIITNNNIIGRYKKNKKFKDQYQKVLKLQWLMIFLSKKNNEKVLGIF